MNFNDMDQELKFLNKHEKRIFFNSRAAKNIFEGNFGKEYYDHEFGGWADDGKMAYNPGDKLYKDLNMILATAFSHLNELSSVTDFLMVRVSKNELIAYSDEGALLLLLDGNEIKDYSICTGAFAGVDKNAKDLNEFCDKYLNDFISKHWDDACVRFYANAK